MINILGSGYESSCKIRLTCDYFVFGGEYPTEAYLRKRIGASTFCVISQFCDFKYRKLSLFSGIF